MSNRVFQNGLLFFFLLFIGLERGEAAPVATLTGGVLWVDDNASGAVQDGSAAHPFSTIQQAINIAGTGQEIRVVQGTYTSAAGDIVTWDQAISGVRLLGGYSAVEGTRNPAQFLSILDGQNLLGRRCVTIANIDSSCEFSGFLLRGGNAESEIYVNYRDGGGMRINAGNLKISHCVFESNSSQDLGGALASFGSSPLIENCKFISNRSKQGGGIFTREGTPVLSDCVFIANEAEQGAGLFYSINAGDVAIRKSLFLSNIATESGGGIFVECDDMKIENCSFVSNQAGHGAGVYLETGACCDSSNYQVKNCAFIKNYAVLRGGGLHSASTTLGVQNCTFLENIAVEGSGVSVLGGLNSISNSILWDGYDDNLHSELHCAGFMEVNYSNIRGGYQGVGSGNINLDPQFVGSGNFHLLSTSPCRNTGAPGFVPASGETDLDGQPRVSGNRVDMGADEFSTQNPSGNSPPIVNAGQNVSITLPIFSIPLQGSLSDDGLPGPVLRSAWSKAQGPGKVEFQNALHAQTVASFSAPGFYRINLTATDGELISVAQIQVTVNANPQPAVLWVDDNSQGNSIQNGSSQFPFSKIKQAIAAAAPGDRIRVVAGEYSEESGSIIYWENKSLTIQGGFAATGSELRDPRLYLSVIDGSELLSSQYEEDFSVVTIGLDSTSEFSGFLVRNGYGGMANDHSDLAILDCVFYGNQRGGMINRNFSSPRIEKCAFISNRSNDGAGLYNSLSSPKISKCLFLNNYVRRDGGALYHTDFEYPNFGSLGQTLIQDTLFLGNQAGELGFEDGVHYGSGAMVFFSGAGAQQPRLDRCVIANNSAPYGGAIGCYYGSPEFRNCALIGNVGFEQGGAAYLGPFGSPRFVNSTFMDNNSPAGFVIYSGWTSASIRRCILWSSGVTNSSAIEYEDQGGCAPQIYYSCVQGGFLGPGNIQTSPQFVSAGNFHLSASSPCINSGDTVNLLPGETDLDGETRVTGPKADMGADEYLGTGSGNLAPLVQAGVDLVINLPTTTANIQASVNDSTLPQNLLLMAWTKKSGPGDVIFSNPMQASTAVSFSAPGTYILRLLAWDGVYFAHDEIQVTLLANPQSPILWVDSAAQGSNIQNGSASQPFATIQQAVDAAALGDRIHVVGGNYTTASGDIVVWEEKDLILRGGFAAAGSTVRNPALYRSILDGLQLQNRSCVVVRQLTSSSEFSGFVLRNLGRTNPGFYYAPSGYPSFRIEGADLLISDCVFEDNFATEATVRIIEGYPFLPASPTIQNCKFLRNYGYNAGAISIYPAEDERSHPVIRNCLFDSNQVSSGATAISVFLGDASILNSTFVRNKQWQVSPSTKPTIGIGFNTGDVILDGNILWNDPAEVSEISVHDWYESSLTVRYCDVQGGYTGVGNISANPQIAVGDFHLSANSPCINAGNPAFSAVFGESDLDGGARRVGNRMDIGADEFSNGNGPVNQAPIANAGADQAITLPAVANLLGQMQDDGLPVPGICTYSWSKLSGPGNVSFANSSALQTTASFSLTGSYVLRLTVNDSALQSSDDLNVTVNAAAGNPCAGNLAPIANAGPDRSGSLAQALSFSGSASTDANGNATIVSYWWNFGDGQFANWQASASVSHSFAAAGNYSVRLWVKDSCGAMSASDTAIVTIGSNNPCNGNTAPIANAGPNKSGQTSQSLSFSASGSSDPGGSISSYSWNFGDGQSASGVSTSHSYASAGSFTVTLTVIDNCSASSSDIALVTIQSQSNQAPAVNAGLDQSITLPALANLDATVSDDGLPSNPGQLSFAWTKQSGPGNVSFGNSLASDTSASFSIDGSYVLRLTVSDGALSATDTVSITVNAEPPIEPGIFWVDDNAANNPTQNGSSANPFGSIQQAINAAAPDNEIRVVAGTYTKINGHVLDWQNKDLKIRGGYAAVGSTVRNPAQYPCIIDGNNLANRSCIVARNLNEDAELSGFTIKRGNYFQGGGMHNDASHLLIANCIFIENQSPSFGGAIYMKSFAEPVIRNCKFQSNSAVEGGAIYSSDCYPNLRNCAFLLNTASSMGGALRSKYSNLTIASCSFIANAGGSNNAGHALAHLNGSSTINNSLFWDGTSGAEIYKQSGTLTVSYSDVRGGYAGTGNLNVNPQLATNSDFHIGNNSPCKNAGDPMYQPESNELDLDSEIRVKEGRIDIGCDEK